MAIDFPASPTAGQQYTFGGVTYTFTAQGVWVVASSAGAVAQGSRTPQGRLTLLTGNPVMPSTQAGKTALLYSPYVGDMLPVSDGSIVTMTQFAELSIATTDTTKNPSAIGASKVNDWFTWMRSGVLTLSHGPDWTSDILRSAGTVLVRGAGGLQLNSVTIGDGVATGPAALKGTYVGTTRSNASSQLDWIYGGVSPLGTAGFFGLWNAHNRVDVGTFVGDSSINWTYSSTAIHAANGSNAMRVSMVRGLDEDAVTAIYSAMTSGATNGFAIIGIDSTSVMSGTNQGGGGPSVLCPTAAQYEGLLGLGFHFVQACEANQAAAAQVYYGIVGAAGFAQSGLSVNLRA
jgi:hypothetical protein